MATVGWASLQIIPSMQGVAAEVSRGLGGMRQAGATAGQEMGQGVADGLKRAESVVAKASKAVAKTRELEVAASAKVRIEEAKLQELRDKGITDGSRFMAAEERLRVARDRGIQATRNARQASEDLTEAQRRLAAASRETADAVDETAAAFEEAGEAGGSAFASIGAKAKEAVTSLQGMAIGAVAIGATITAGIAEAMNTEVINDKLAASLGASPALAGEYGKIAGDLYRNAYGESLEQVTESVGIVQASFKTLGFEGEASIDQVTGRAMDFAAVFGVEVTDSVQTVSQLINQGLVKDSTEGFDLLTTAFQRVPAAMRDELPMILQEYGVSFNALGFTGEQAFNSLVLASEKGAFALDKTGDALKEFTILGTDMSESSQEAYKAIDLDAKAMADSIIAGGPAAQDALQKTAQGLLAMPDAQERATTAIALFGAPLEDLSVDQIPAFLEGLAGTENAMAGFEGSTDAMGATLSDNWTTKLESIKRSIQGAFIDGLGVALTFAFEQMGKLTPVFNEISGGVRAFVAAFVDGGDDVTSSGFAGFLEQLGIHARNAFDVFNADVLPVLRTLGEILLNVGQVAFPIIITALGTAFDTFTTLAGVVSGFVGFLTEHKDITIAVAGVITALFLPAMVSLGISFAVAAGQSLLMTARLAAYVVVQGAVNAATKAWAATQWLLNAALTANPIGLIVAGIAAVVAAIVLIATKTTWFQDIWGVVWGGIKTAWDAVWENALKPGFDALMVAIDFIVDHWKIFAGVLAVIMGPVGIAIGAIVLLVKNFDKVKAAIGAVGDAAMWLWNEAIMPAFNGIKTVFDLWWAGVQIYFDALQLAWKGIETAAFWLYNNVFTPVFDGIKSVISIWWTTIQVIFDALQAAWKGIETAAFWLYNNVFTPVFDGIKTAISNFWTGVEVIFNLIKDGIGWIGAKAVEVKDTIVGAFDSVVNFVAGIGERIKTGAGNIWGFLIDGLKAAIHAVGSVLKKVNIKIPDWVPKVGGKEFGFKAVGEAMEQLRDGGVVNGQAGRRADGSLWGPGTGVSDSLLGVDDFGMPIVRVSAKETVVTADASADPANAAAMAAMNGGWSISDWLKKLPGHANGGVIQNGAELTSPIQHEMWDAVRAQFPDVELLSGTRYADVGSGFDNHMGERALDLSPNPDIANWIYQMNNSQPVEELIHWPLGGWENLKAGQPMDYGAATNAQHEDHTHWAMKDFTNKPVDTGPLEQPGLVTSRDGTVTPPSSSTSAAPSTSAEPEKAFSGRDRFKKLFTDLGGIASDSLIEIAGVGEWLDLADRYTIKPSDTAATSSTPQAPTTPSGATGDASSMEMTYPVPNAEPPAPTSGPDFYSHEIARAAKESGLDRLAAVIGHMTSLVEVGDPLKMFANNAIPESLSFPHDAVGSDHDSVGLFQQRPGWGTVAQRMNPFESAGMFYDKLDDFDYASMAPGDAAQKVQQSGFPAKYQPMLPRAEELVNQTGLFDTGGWLMPGQLSYNGLNEPEPILERSQWDTAEAAINTVKDLAMSGGGSAATGDTYVTHATFRDESGYYQEERRRVRLSMTRYSGRRRRR